MRLLTALADGPRSLAQLRTELGSPPQTTVRGHLRSLVAAAAVEKRCHGGFPGSVDYRLTAAGRELIGIAEIYSSWLALAPDGSKLLGTAAAKRATRALVEGWACGIVRALADRPRSLTELNRLISARSYPALERRLAKMRRLGLVQPVAGDGGRTPFVPSEWLRLARASMEAASRWESKWALSGAEEKGRSPIAL
jgi:DNA-binding HxlR family transcriptional regulator